MKDSGVSWLGEIPEHWSVAPLKTEFTRVKRKTIEGAGIVTAFRDGEVTLRSNRRSEGFTEADDYSGYQRILPNDLAIHSMDAFAGAIGVSDSDGMCSPVLSVCTASNGNDPRFMGYQMRLMAERGWIESLSRSVRERTSEFRWAEAGKQKVALPPIEEQKAIADFLDREVAQIDLLIEKQNQLVATLQERLKAEVREKTFANVGGLAGFGFTADTTKRLPESWNMGQLAHLVSLFSGNSIDSALIEQGGSFPVYGANGFRGFTETSNLNKEVLLVGRVGALCGNVHHISGEVWVTEHALIAEPRKSFNFSWLRHTLRAMNLGQYATSTAQPVIAAGVISKLRLPIPPLAAQVAIGEELDSEERKVENLVALAVEVINSLLERRMAIISCATTGKIDVRGRK